MISNGISYLVATVAGAWLLRRRIGRLGLASLSRLAARVFGAGAVAGLAAVGGAALAGGLDLGVKTASLVQVAVGGAALLMIYFACAYLLGVREVSALVKRRIAADEHP